jgi:hypothetical protein
VDVTKLQELKNWFNFWHFHVKQWGVATIGGFFSWLWTNLQDLMWQDFKQKAM